MSNDSISMEESSASASYKFHWNRERCQILSKIDVKLGQLKVNFSCIIWVYWNRFADKNVYWVYQWVTLEKCNLHGIHPSKWKQFNSLLSMLNAEVLYWAHRVIHDWYRSCQMKQTFNRFICSLAKMRFQAIGKLFHRIPFKVNLNLSVWLCCNLLLFLSCLFLYGFYLRLKRRLSLKLLFVHLLS